MVKKSMMIVLLGMACMGSRAQEGNGDLSAKEAGRKFRIGLTGGMNVSSPTNVATKVGYQVGVRGEWDFKGRASGPFLSIGALLSEKGWRQKYYAFTNPDDPLPRTMTRKANPTYLEVPVHFGYRWAVGRNVSLFASAGLFGNFGLFGKERCKLKKPEDGLGMTQSEQWNNNLFSWDYSDLVRCDWGLGYRVGVEFNRHYQLSVSNDWGLRNNQDYVYSPKLKSRNFALAFTYMF